MEKRDIRISSSLDLDVTHTKQDISISAHIKSHNPHIKKKKRSTSTVTYLLPGLRGHKSKIDLQNDFFMCIERAVTTGVAKG